jgi:hypothetical protein
MKRTILIAVIAALVAPIWAQDTGITPDGFDWYLTRDKKGVIIQGYTGTALDVNIPAKINNLPVVEIDVMAFSANIGGQTKGLTRVIIPNTVTKIGEQAFTFQTSLTSVTLPSSLVEIGKQAFYNCKALTTVTIPASVTKITFGANVFQAVTNLNAVTVQALTNRGYKF